MFFPEGTLKIWLYTRPTDMRKSFDGLCALIKQQLNANPLSGELFVFVNQRRTLMKILFFDRTGYSIWFKRLEQGAFQLPSTSGEQAPLNYTQLKCIMEGIDIHSVKQRLRYTPTWN